MVKTQVGHNSDESGRSNGQGVNLPNERTEVKIKTELYHFLLNNIPFEGDPTLVSYKAKELAGGLYEMFVGFRTY